MNLKDIRIECTLCRVHFTPSHDRAKYLMDRYGAIGRCRECYNDHSINGGIDG
tara:strand:+ start:138 stop:296 length:159 start_codon:yes stop_codon:yes gene_type:complete